VWALLTPSWPASFGTIRTVSAPRPKRSARSYADAAHDFLFQYPGRGRREVNAFLTAARAE
jgi:hypothetical protein